MMVLRKILVTTDRSEYSLAAMEYASSLGVLYSSALFLLHVVDHHERRQIAGDDRAQRILDDFIARKIGLKTTLVPQVRFGVPALEICRFAEEEGVDLVVMATHGRTGLSHILMGSVAERVVRSCSVPVLTVKPRPVRESLLQREDIEKDLHLR